jgi:hypothetical protein
MRISNTSPRVAIACLCALTFPLQADDVTLTGGDSHLSGTVRSIDASGLVELVSPLSPEPLFVKGESLDKVEFSGEGPAPGLPPALLELTNGDLLPVTIEGLDERVLSVTSPAAGKLVIPRDRLASAQLGVRRHKVIYAGPKSLDEWTKNWGDPKNWEYKSGTLVAQGPATAARKLDLPRQFILRFSLAWEARQNPNFQVHFADPLKAKGEACDRYYLQFGGAGLEIKREAASGRRYNTIAQLNRTPNQYPDRQLRVEIRVDRVGSRLHLFINGEPEGEYGDPIAPIPDGSGISLVCNASNGSEQTISEIEITEFDDTRARHQAEDRGDPKNDSLISIDDDRWGGSLLDIRKTGQTTIFRFKSDFQDEPLEVPEADVSTVFFASKSDAPKAPGEAPFVLHLRGEGHLRVNSCRFSADTVSADHPLLGELQIRRDGVISLVHLHPETKPAP